jgi:hypothetical protein
MINNGAARVSYYDQQFLRAEDFRAEQEYQMMAQRIHNLSAHTGGILFGLEVVQTPKGDLYVNPGVAVDGYGRTLVLPQQRPLDPSAFDQLGTDTLDVWLVYAEQDTNPAEQGYAACQPDDGKTEKRITGARRLGRSSSQPQSYRVKEIAEVRVLKHNPDRYVMVGDPPRRQPETVLVQDLEAGPSQIRMVDASQAWPVFLAQLQRKVDITVDGGQTNSSAQNNTGSTGNSSILVDPSGRPYAGLVGEAIQAPTGKARLQIGAENPGDDLRFAVFLDEDGVKPEDAPRFSIDRTGNVDICGNTNLFGNLTVDGGAVVFEDGGIPTEPQPWSIYRVNVPPDPSDNQKGGAGDNQNPHSELRIEMEQSSDDTVVNQVAIGYFSTQEKSFVPCLMVDDSCNVRIGGNLMVNTLTDLTGNPISPLNAQAHLLEMMAKDERILRRALDLMDPDDRKSLIEKIRKMAEAEHAAAIRTPEAKVATSQVPARAEATPEFMAPAQEEVVEDQTASRAPTTPAAEEDQQPDQPSPAEQAQKAKTSSGRSSRSRKRKGKEAGRESNPGEG